LLDVFELQGIEETARRTTPSQRKATAHNFSFRQDFTTTIRNSITFLCHLTTKVFNNEMIMFRNDRFILVLSVLGVLCLAPTEGRSLRHTRKLDGRMMMKYADDYNDEGLVAFYGQMMKGDTDITLDDAGDRTEEYHEDEETVYAIGEGGQTISFHEEEEEEEEEESESEEESPDEEGLVREQEVEQQQAQDKFNFADNEEWETEGRPEVEPGENTFVPPDSLHAFMSTPEGNVTDGEGLTDRKDTIGDGDVIITETVGINATTAENFTSGNLMLTHEEKADEHDYGHGIGVDEGEYYGGEGVWDTEDIVDDDLITLETNYTNKEVTPQDLTERIAEVEIHVDTLLALSDRVLELEIKLEKAMELIEKHSLSIGSLQDVVLPDQNEYYKVMQFVDEAEPQNSTGH
jgi:hypothetical protein